MVNPILEYATQRCSRDGQCSLQQICKSKKRWNLIVTILDMTLDAIRLKKRKNIATDEIKLKSTLVDKQMNI